MKKKKCVCVYINNIYLHVVIFIIFVRFQVVNKNKRTDSTTICQDYIFIIILFFVRFNLFFFFIFLEKKYSFEKNIIIWIEISKSYLLLYLFSIKFFFIIIFFDKIMVMTNRWINRLKDRERERSLLVVLNLTHKLKNENKIL